MNFGVTTGGGGDPPISGGVELALMALENLRKIKWVS